MYEGDELRLEKVECCPSFGAGCSIEQNADPVDAYKDPLELVTG